MESKLKSQELAATAKDARETEKEAMTSLARANVQVKTLSKDLASQKGKLAAAKKKSKLTASAQHTSKSEKDSATKALVASRQKRDKMIKKDESIAKSAASLRQAALTDKIKMVKSTSASKVADETSAAARKRANKLAAQHERASANTLAPKKALAEAGAARDTAMHNVETATKAKKAAASAKVKADKALAAARTLAKQTQADLEAKAKVSSRLSKNHMDKIGLVNKAIAFENAAKEKMEQDELTAKNAEEALAQAHATAKADKATQLAKEEQEQKAENKSKARTAESNAANNVASTKYAKYEGLDKVMDKEEELAQKAAVEASNLEAARKEQRKVATGARGASNDANVR
jgi:hypothetical protein